MLYGKTKRYFNHWTLQQQIVVNLCQIELFVGDFDGLLFGLLLLLFVWCLRFGLRELLYGWILYNVYFDRYHTLIAVLEICIEWVYTG